MARLLWPIIAGVALLAAQVNAQDSNMQILLEQIKADKKAVVAANMDLSNDEARAFWPVYDRYQADLGVINDRLAKAIVAYADAYNAGPIPDATARRLLDEAITLDEMEVRLRREYVPRLSWVIPTPKVARYLQIESKIRAAIRYELAKQIPLVE